MKKVGFMVQVLTIIIALPLLTILELNHVNPKATGKKTGNYVIAPAEKNAGALNTSVNGRMPS